MKTIMIVTGESSGELYGSLLAKELKKSYPDVRIVGIGGDRMRKVGVELISGISSAFGISELFSALRDLKSAFKRTKETITELMPDVLVLIDFPDFNIKVAGFAKKCKIKILYYVSPQVWAWRKGRVKKIAGLVDRMAVVLPFEAEIYRQAGVPCEFVGHPIVEEIEDVLRSINPPFPPFTEGGIIDSGRRAFFKTSLGLNAPLPLLSLLPGSRSHELKRLLPLMIEVIRQYKKEFSDYQFCVPLAPNTDEGRYSHYLETLKREGVVIKKGESIKVLAASDMSVIASGTATLQAAFLEVPMVVIYKLSPLTYLLGRFFVDVEHISLVNILSKRGVVPVLLQQKASPEGITMELKKIMEDKPKREEMVKYFRALKEPFSGLGASKRVTEMIIEMAGW